MEVMNEESAGTGVLISWGKRSLEYTRDRLEEVALNHERRSIFWLLVLPHREFGLSFIWLTRLHVTSRTTDLVTEDWITQGCYYRILTPTISCLISTLATCCIASLACYDRVIPRYD
jgi:hypothetical protein